jgi:hypothetical protein
MKSSVKKLTATPSNPSDKSSHHVHHHNTGKTASATRHTTKSDANLFGFKTHIKIYHGFGSFFNLNVKIDSNKILEKYVVDFKIRSFLILSTN